MNHWRAVAVPAPVQEVVDALVERISAATVVLFACYDHAANARGAGLTLPEETVLVFGSPAVGTALMQEDSDVGYELPLRVLIRASGEPGHSVISYRDPAWMVGAYSLDASRPIVQNLSEFIRHLISQTLSSLSAAEPGDEEVTP